jgi:hypothetical protein
VSMTKVFVCCGRMLHPQFCAILMYLGIVFSILCKVNFYNFFDVARALLPASEGWEYNNADVCEACFLLHSCTLL